MGCAISSRQDAKPEPLSFKENMLFNSIGSIMYQGCLWLTTVLVVILSSGYNDSGLLSYAMTIGNMFNPIATYSMRSYQVSDVSETYTQRNYVGFRLLTLLLGFLFIVPYTLLTTTDGMTIQIICIYLLFKTDEAFVDVLYGVDQRSERMDYIGISQFVRGVVLVAAFSVGLIATNSLSVAIIAMTIGCVSITILYDIPHSLRLDALRPRIGFHQVLHLLKTCLPIVLSTLFIGMVVSVARQYFSNAFGTEQLGRYAAVATPAVLVQVAARYLYSPALVPLSECWGKGVEPFKKQLTHYTALMVIACLGMVLVLSALGAPLLTLVYGSSIVDYVYLFPSVLIGTACLAMVWYLTDILVICRNLRGMLVVASVTIGSALLLTVPFETSMGMDGINNTIIVSAVIGIVAATLLLRLSMLARGKESDSLLS